MIKPNYFLIPIIGILMNVIGSQYTKKGMDWYRTLILPDLAPPGYFIGIVWMVITTLTCISAIIVWNSFKRDKEFNQIIVLFISSVFFNMIWSYLFFYKHLIVLSIIDMILLIITMIILIFKIKKESKVASTILYLYPLWVSFATYLTISIWKLNPQAF